MLEGIGNAFSLGAQAIYIYDLMDGDDFGIFRADGSPKPAATAIHNMVAIMGATASTSTAAPNAPIPSMSGFSGSGHGITLWNGQNGFDVMVWDEQGTSNVTVNLGKVYNSVQVYDPLQGTSPISSFGSTSQVNLNVTTPLIIIAQ